MALTGPIYDKTFELADRCVALFKVLQRNREYNLSSQMERSGTSVGAMVREAKFAQSKADFISKMQIGLKEANETQYWLKLLWRNEYIDEKTFNYLYGLADEVISMLVAIIRTSKNNM
ncbi:MAG: four helix bundle protein [Bacteroidales bacterium]|nr:four helix bundle protein [Bacteroidales bacterium]